MFNKYHLKKCKKLAEDFAKTAAYCLDMLKDYEETNGEVDERASLSLGDFSGRAKKQSQELSYALIELRRKASEGGD